MKILAVLPFLLAITTAQAEHQFIVFSDGIDFKKEVNTLINNGARVEKKVPPRIVVADVPPSMNLEGISTVDRIYTNEARLDELSSLGPIAVAAGRQWNSNVLTRASSSMGASAFSALSTRVAALSLPYPTGISASKQGMNLKADWDSSLGTGLFHLQLSPDPSFTTQVLQTQTNNKTVLLPYISEFSEKNLYIRMRSFERSNNQDDLKFLYGSWSASQSIGANSVSQNQNLSAPSLTSPLNGYQSEGFTLILEWAPHSGDNARVQVARDSGFTDTFIDSVVDQREFIVPSGTLEVGNNYYWRVQAWGNQTSPWSAVRTFHVNEPRHIGSDMFVNPERPE